MLEGRHDAEYPDDWNEGSRNSFPRAPGPSAADVSGYHLAEHREPPEYQREDQDVLGRAPEAEHDAAGFEPLSLSVVLVGRELVRNRPVACLLLFVSSILSTDAEHHCASLLSPTFVRQNIVCGSSYLLLVRCWSCQKSRV